jgi:hypothetical protein
MWCVIPNGLGTRNTNNARPPPLTSLTVGPGLAAARDYPTHWTQRQGWGNPPRGTRAKYQDTGQTGWPHAAHPRPRPPSLAHHPSEGHTATAPELGSLGGQDARAASLLDLGLGVLAEVLGLDNDGVGRQVALAQNLEEALHVRWTAGAQCTTQGNRMHTTQPAVRTGAARAAGARVCECGRGQGMAQSPGKARKNGSNGPTRVRARGQQAHVPTSWLLCMCESPAVEARGHNRGSRARARGTATNAPKRGCDTHPPTPRTLALASMMGATPEALPASVLVRSCSAGVSRLHSLSTLMVGQWYGLRFRWK